MPTGVKRGGGADRTGQALRGRASAQRDGHSKEQGCDESMCEHTRPGPSTGRYSLKSHLRFN